MTTKKEISPLAVVHIIIYKEAKCILMNSDITNIYQRSTSLSSHIAHCLNQNVFIKTSITYQVGGRRHQTLRGMKLPIFEVPT